MKTNIIQEEDVSRVARDLNIIMNKTQVQKVLECMTMHRQMTRQVIGARLLKVLFIILTINLL